MTGLTRSGTSTDGWTLVATWSGGVAPYTAVAASDPSFQIDVTTIGMEMNGTSAQIIVDPGNSGQFFNVVDGSTVSPAVQGLGYDLLPAPETTSASTTTIWWGQEVTLYGNYLSPIAKDNPAFMYDLPVKGASSNVPTGSRFANAVTFEVPEDARAFPAIVSTLGKWRCCFADAPWVTMSPPAIGPYTDITGLEWSPLSGNVWVSATGVVEEIDLFNQEPSIVWTTGSFTLPYISRTTTTGTVLVIDKTSPGEILEIDSGGGAQHFAWTTDDGFTRTVTPVGLAVDPDGSAAYIADAAEGRVVRIPRGAGPGSTEIADAWGGMYYLGFGDPCGIDVAPTHEVLMVNENDGYTYKLTGPSTTWLDKGVGTGIHSLDIDRDVSSAAGLFYVTSHDRASIEAFNTRTLNAGGGPRFRGGRIFGLEDGTLVLEPDFVFAAYRHFPQKVILSNEVEEYPYPSQYQIGDRFIRMDGQGWEGIDVHLRLIDPPDLAPYAPEGGWPDPPDPDVAGNPVPAVLPYEGNDNAGYADSDYGLSLNPDGPWTMTLQATPVKIGNNDIYTYYLKVPENYSGDNYQVEITKCDANGTVLPERVAAMSSIYTSWKRIFVERDSMFRKGGVLAEAYDPDTCGGVNLPCDQIRVYEWANVEVGDWIVVFDEWAGAEEFSFFFERLLPVREVMTVGAADANGHKILTLDSDLDRPFRASPSVLEDPGDPGNDVRQPVFCDDDGVCHVSGFGVVSGCDLDWNQINGAGSCFFNVDLRGVERSFGDAFVEVHAPRNGRNLLPFLPRNWMNWAIDYGSPDPEPPLPIDFFSIIWFKTGVRSPATINMSLVRERLRSMNIGISWQAFPGDILAGPTSSVAPLRILAFLSRRQRNR